MTLTQLVWLTGPRASGKSTIAKAFERELYCVDLDCLLTRLNERVPKEYRYDDWQDWQGFKRMRAEQPEAFRHHLQTAWTSFSGTAKDVLAVGWHAKEDWIRAVIKQDALDNRNPKEHFLLIIQRVEKIQENIKRRDRKRDHPFEEVKYCCDEGKKLLIDSVARFERLSLGGEWLRLDDAAHALRRIASLTGVTEPPPPVDWE
ncbi:MAG: adenylyl-sulfate kinase [Planctomycetales bacterium]|nr:adenylyl-sulfate kinase [Planctomycetales bacterium]